MFFASIISILFSSILTSISHSQSYSLPLSSHSTLCEILRYLGKGTFKFQKYTILWHIRYGTHICVDDLRQELMIWDKYIWNEDIKFKNIYIH